MRSKKVWLVGDQFAAAEYSFQTYPNVQEVIKELEADKPKGYTILIKGSNGIKAQFGCRLSIISLLISQVFIFEKKILTTMRKILMPMRIFSHCNENSFFS